MTPGSVFQPKLGERGSLTPHFADASQGTPAGSLRRGKRKTAPFCIRLTDEERKRLEHAAGAEPLGSYIRSRLLEGQPTRRRSQRNPVADHAALARVLGQLGQSRLANNLNQLARAANIGALPVTPEIEAELRDACGAVRAMRADLMRALGFTEGPP